VTLAHPTLDLWEEPAPDHRERVVANSDNRIAWLRARSRGVTATDAARLSSSRAVQTVVQEKLSGTGFGGNAFTDHGRAREPEIARWVLAEYGIAPSSHLYHAHGQPLHLATPDGVRASSPAGASGGSVVLCEIKTTSHAWRSIPRSYLRQVCARRRTNARRMGRTHRFRSGCRRSRGAMGRTRRQRDSRTRGAGQSDARADGAGIPSLTLSTDPARSDRNPVDDHPGDSERGCGELRVAADLGVELR
jgi:hypothetical protein